MTNAPAAPAGWYPSPSRPGQLQWFDGTAWQEFYAPAGGGPAGGWPHQAPGGGFGMAPRGQGFGAAGTGSLLAFRWAMVAVTAVIVAFLALDGDTVFALILGVLLVLRVGFLVMLTSRRRKLRDRFPNR